MFIYIYIFLYFFAAVAGHLPVLIQNVINVTTQEWRPGHREKNSGRERRKLVNIHEEWLTDNCFIFWQIRQTLCFTIAGDRKHYHKRLYLLLKKYFLKTFKDKNSLVFTV